VRVCVYVCMCVCACVCVCVCMCMCVYVYVCVSVSLLSLHRAPGRYSSVVSFCLFEYLWKFLHTCFWFYFHLHHFPCFADINLILYYNVLRLIMITNFFVATLISMNFFNSNNDNDGVDCQRDMTFNQAY